MGWFSRSNDNERFVLLVDVGSGSVGIAISHEELDKPKPKLIWSYREYMLIKDEVQQGYSLREINTTIINAFLRLGSDGLKKFRELHPKEKIETIQLTISAPWSYTVTKNVQYSEEHPFKITDTLIAELTETANQKVMEMALEQDILSSHNLLTIETKTIGVLANEYPLTSYAGVSAKNISLIHVTSVTHEKIIEIVREAQAKVIPRTNLEPHAFMYVYYDTMRDLAPDTTEACLIDITMEATEMAILRDNLMLHTSHVTAGAFGIVREIATIADIPKEEAYAFIRGGESFIAPRLSATKQEAIAGVFTDYQERLRELFQQTGDTLAIPKTIFLHVDADSEAFFKQHVTTAARKATSSDHTVHLVTSKLLSDDTTQTDTAMMLSATYSHKHWREGGDD